MALLNKDLAGDMPSMEKLNLRVTPGKRKRSNSCRSISNEAGPSQKFAKIEGTKLGRDRFLKRRRSQTMFFRKRRSSINGQPFKFFYGGSIADPLNLNGLINRSELSNTVTPMGSPMITPLRGDVLLPIFHYTNINDPLNLGGEYPDDFLNIKPKPRTRKRRYSYKKHNKPKEETGMNEPQDNLSLNASSNNEEIEAKSELLPISNKSEIAQISDECTLIPLDITTDQNVSITSDKHLEPGPSKAKQKSRRPKQPPVIKHKTKNALFKFGNYSSYVGYCNLKNCDARVDIAASEDLHGKSVLDIGCNVGNVTIKIARDHRPRRVVGIDVDPHLIHVANKNLSYFSNMSNTQQSCCPCSMKTLYGPLTSHPLLKMEDNVAEGTFPFNIEFKVVRVSQYYSGWSMHNVCNVSKYFQENYVPLSNFEAKMQKPEFDVIVAFRVTKYIQLNHGDDGLKRTFVKIFNHLKPGGKLYLQAQDWQSYKEKKKLTVSIQCNKTYVCIYIYIFYVYIYIFWLKRCKD